MPTHFSLPPAGSGFLRTKLQPAHSAWLVPFTACHTVLTPGGGAFAGLRANPHTACVAAPNLAQRSTPP